MRTQHQRARCRDNFAAVPMSKNQVPDMLAGFRGRGRQGSICPDGRGSAAAAISRLVVEVVHENPLCCRGGALSVVAKLPTMSPSWTCARCVETGFQVAGSAP
jgi:hypothetical protein